MAWLSGRQKTTERKTQLASIASGQAQIIIGTHALFQDEVEFAGLGLVVIDEQHRFGVHQRLALRKKGEADNVRPHQLIMTATPIPRTLAQTAYADLDVSVIDELPPGRKKIKTVAMPNERRSEVVARVAEACKAGQQCYWVCTLVEESDVLQSEAAENSYAQLQQALPQLRIGLVHGRMKAAEKDNVMQAFKVGEIQLLVATTVIEVGVDVANASLMIIENAERLGLSQLHQLRGRVGRGSRQSACVLLYQPPLSDNARLRLQALRESQDGFRIAEIDLELRGPGELLGTRQAGIMQFRIADLLRDQALIPQAKAGAQLILSKYPERVEPLLLRWFGEHTEYQKI
jgi:ATP-dependent DNA helicase RecG